jgi:hypothetical protein
MATDAASDEAREHDNAEGEQAFSGRLLLRMPPTLHAALAREAERERTSLNRFIVTALAQTLAPRETEERDEPDPGPAQRSPRLLGAALVVNLVAVVVAGAVAIALLAVALSRGL